MKKLALVQDPSLYDRSKSILNGEGPHVNQGDAVTGKQLPPKVAPKPNGAVNEYVAGIASNGNLLHNNI